MSETKSEGNHLYAVAMFSGRNYLRGPLKADEPLRSREERISLTTEEVLEYKAHIWADDEWQRKFRNKRRC